MFRKANNELQSQLYAAVIESFRRFAEEVFVTCVRDVKEKESSGKKAFEKTWKPLSDLLITGANAFYSANKDKFNNDTLFMNDMQKIVEDTLEKLKNFLLPVPDNK